MLIYKGLGFSDKDLKEEVEQANHFGLQPSYKETPQELAKSYAKQYRQEQDREAYEDAKFVDMAYGRD